MLAGSASAQFNWTSAAGGNWSDPTNWGGTAPPSGGSGTTTLTFGLGSSYTATNDFPGVFNLNQLTFASAVGTTQTLVPSGGSSLNFTGTTPTINLSGSGTGLINLPVTFDADLTVANIGGGPVTFGSTVTNASGLNNLLKTATGNLTLAGGGSFRQLSVQNGSAFVTGGTLALTADSGTGNVNSGLQLASATGQNVNFTASGGATINVTENIYIADATGSSAVMNVTGPGTVVNNVGPVSGRFGIGNSGTGTLNVTNGGVVNTALFFVSRLAGGSGTVLIDGPGSAVNATVQLSAGTSSLGTITIQNGGSASSGNTVNIGRAVGVGTGIVTVTGAGSLLAAGATTNTGTIVPGREGDGTLNVQNGASVTSSFPGAANSAMVIGLAANSVGTLNVQSGGTVNLNGNLRAGLVAPSTATITVTGTGSLVASTEQIQLGGNGPTPGGTVTTTIDSGGVMRSTGGTFLHGTATTNVNAGGTMSAGFYGDGAAGSVGNIATQAGGNVTITGVAATTGSYSGVISGGGAVQRSGAGTQIFAGANTYTGGTTISAGTLLVANTTGSGTGTGTTNVNGTGILGGTGSISGPVTSTLGGRVAPGMLATDAGILTLTNATSLDGTSTLSINLNGIAPGNGAGFHDQLNLGTTGSISFNGAVLDVMANTLALDGTTPVTIVQGPANSIASGNIFAGLPDGATFVIPNTAGAAYFATIDYDYAAGTVVLSGFTPVPEPTALLLCGAAASWFGVRRVRRRKAG